MDTETGGYWEAEVAERCCRGLDIFSSHHNDDLREEIIFDNLASFTASEARSHRPGHFDGVVKDRGTNTDS